MSRADRRAEKAAAKAAKAEAKLGEKIEDAYDDSDRTLSHDEACRDSVYALPSPLKHIGVCYMTQMKRFTKQRTVWLMAILLIAIPVAYYILKGQGFIEPFGIANTTMGTILVLLPIMSALMATVTCASMLPTEFNERTVYLSLPLPVSRRSFYVGKFLAGFSITAGTVLAAYGISLLVSISEGGDAYTGPMLTSLVLALCGIFFLCALAYRISAKSRRAAVLKILLMMLVAIPGLAIVLAYLLTKVPEIDLTAYNFIFGYFPCFAPDLAIVNLGAPVFMGSNIWASLYGILQVFGIQAYIPGFNLGTSPAIMCIVSVVIGLLLLESGYRKIARRDM